MIARDDVERRWASDGVCRVRPELLFGVNLPPKTLSILSEWGLPCKERYLFQAHQVGDQLMLVERRYDDSPGSWYKIGTDLGADICLRQHTGEVMALSDGRELKDRFVNSSLETFLTFLLLVSRHRTDFAGAADDVIDVQLAALKSQLTQ